MNQDVSNYREKLGKAYFEIETSLNKMDTFLRGAEEHKREISKEEAAKVQEFLEEVGTLLQENFILFVGMSE